MKELSLGDRMKLYEKSFNYRLTPRMPCIIRIDGRCFHSLVKKWGCAKPFDKTLIYAMQQTALFLCEQIQGAVLAYTQSDEISICLIDYQNLNSQAWFDKKLQKMCSVAASLATKKFNYTYRPLGDNTFEHDLADFDARVFVLPESEVANYFIWRQQDCTRNSVQMAARAVFSHKECDNKNCAELQEMLFTKGINWNDCSTVEKRGTTVISEPMLYKREDGEEYTRNRLRLDFECPIFTQQRDYIEERLKC